MWESPVNIIEIREPIVEEINKQTEEVVFKAIRRVGVDVNKEELIKAIQYDRNQYEKGYADAIDEFAKRLKESYVDHEFDDFLRHDDYSYRGRSMALERYIDEIAEQMKDGE